MRTAPLLLQLLDPAAENGELLLPCAHDVGCVVWISPPQVDMMGTVGHLDGDDAIVVEGALVEGT